MERKDCCEVKTYLVGGAIALEFRTAHQFMKHSMKHILTSILAVLMGASLSAQEVCLDIDFTQGIPSKFTLICNDEMPVNGAGFKNIFPKMQWFVEAAECADGMAVFSTSRRTFDLPTDNWLITPELSLPSENIWLKWTARSIHNHLRDGYKVMISTESDVDLDSFKELKTVEAEEYLWTEHILSLQEYAGQKVRIAFVHNSQNKFLLAIDDIFVGQPAEADFIVEDNTQRFAGNVATVSVTGKVMNSGIEHGSYAFTCVVDGTDVLQSPAFDVAWKTGEEYPFEFEVPVQVGKVTHYKVMIGEHTIVEDSIICSHYPRTLFLEKATGAWCVNCPEMISYIQELEERYGENIVCVEVHGPEGYGGDIWAYAPYYNGMKTNSLPTVLFNRDRTNPLYKSEKSNVTLKKVISDPTVAMVEAEADCPVGDSIKVTAKVTFANNTDNSSDKFRIGYALIEKVAQSETMRQINGCESLRHGEFYYMKSPVASDLMFYSNVVRSDCKAFVGVKKSLPVSIKSEEENLNTAVLNIPATVSNRANLAVVAIVMNYYTDEVLNVTEVKVPLDPQFVSPLLAGQKNEEPVITVHAGGTFRVSCPEQIPFEVAIYSVDGRQVTVWTGNGSAEKDLSGILQGGIYLVRVSQASLVWTRKIVF